MKSVSKFLLIALSLLLAVSGYLSAKAQDIRADKEEAVYYLLGRIAVLNGYYLIGKYENEPRSLANYQNMLSEHTGELTKKIEQQNPRIARYSNWATALLFIAVIGNTTILVIEQIASDRKQRQEAKARESPDSRPVSSLPAAPPVNPGSKA